MEVYFCSKCKEAKFRDEFSGKKTRHRYCKPCSSTYQKGRSRNEHKMMAHPLAYTHVIRCRYKGTLYKCNLPSTTPPPKYELVYKALPGYLLPEKYKDIADSLCD